MTKEQAAAAASPKLKSQSKTKGRSEQGQSKNPEDVAHDSGSEYESDGSEVLRRSDGSLHRCCSKVFRSGGSKVSKSKVRETKVRVFVSRTLPSRVT